MDYKEKVLKSEVIYDGRIVKLTVEDVLLPNGKTSVREIIHRNDSVGVIVLTKDKKIVLVKQYRNGVMDETFEIPAGEIDQGEDKLTSARREMLEETGYVCDDLKLLKTFSSSPATTRSYFHLFIAKDAVKVNEELDLDEDEFLEVVELTFEELEELFNLGKIYDFKTAISYMFLKGNLC